MTGARSSGHPTFKPVQLTRGALDLVNEAPVALVFDGTTAAVMMATPADIGDFAMGFAFSEGFVEDIAEIVQFEEVRHEKGIEARFWLIPERREAVAARRRAMMGPVGCGLCGIDSLDQATRALTSVEGGATIAGDALARAPDTLRARQPLHDRTRSAHAAGFITADGTLLVAREDVGRHNALDKVIGAMIKTGAPRDQGALVMTSRVSVELVQKSATCGFATLVAVSSPTALAVETAEAAGITLACLDRAGGIDVFTHPHRVF
ncbi:MAG: formate dehydrogenase accessory sulfurtransferase FdhD [Pseudomonadota bacterium]